MASSGGVGTSRLDGVQAMRFVAALLVVVTHSTLYAKDRLDPDIEVWRFGEIGVPIFFVISGLVMIVSTAGRERRPGFWSDFATRRIIRIVPTYWFATTVKLLTLVAVPGAVVHATLDWSNVGWSYLFLPSRRPDGSIEPLLGVGWTLIFEMAFYALFTLALFLRVRPLVWCGGALALLALGSAFVGDDPVVPAYYLNPVVLYFLVGMIIGTYVVGRHAGALAVRLTGALALTALICWLGAPEGQVFDTRLFVRVGGVAATILAVVLADRWLRGRVPSPILRLGDASYTMYLFHPLIAPIVPAVLSRAGIISAPLSVALSIALVVAATFVLYRAFEEPLTKRLMRAFRDRRAGGAPTGAAAQDS